MNFGYVLNTLPTLVDISKKLFDTYKKDMSGSGSKKDITISEKIYELENSMLQQADLVNRLTLQVKSMADELNRQRRLVYISFTISAVAVIVAVVAVFVR